MARPSHPRAASEPPAVRGIPSYVRMCVCAYVRHCVCVSCPPQRGTSRSYPPHLCSLRLSPRAATRSPAPSCSLLTTRTVLPHTLTFVGDQHGGFLSDTHPADPRVRPWTSAGGPWARTTPTPPPPATIWRGCCRRWGDRMRRSRCSKREREGGGRRGGGEGGRLAGRGSCPGWSRASARVKGNEHRGVMSALRAGQLYGERTGGGGVP